MTDQPIGVLIAEDDPFIRLDIAYRIEEEGFRAFEAGNADEALALVNTEPTIRLLFTDIAMPGSMDGLRLAETVREGWPPIRIMVTSGHRELDMGDLPDGCVFFPKPYLHAAVISSIRELLT